MGVPFNFTCIGVGTYVCSRCGFELFGSDAKVMPPAEGATPPGPGPKFTKPLNADAVIRLTDASTTTLTTPANSSFSSIAEAEVKIACGNCGTHLGFELIPAGTFTVPSSYLRFVQTKRCAVPLSFLF